jgi:hypothetical protein
LRDIGEAVRSRADAGVALVPRRFVLHSHDTHADVVRRLVELRRIPLLADLSPTVLAGLAEHARDVPVHAGEAFRSGLPATLRLFPGGCQCSGLSEIPGDHSFVGYMPELASWLAGVSLDGEMRARTDGYALDIMPAHLAAILDDEFGLYLALARGLAAGILATRATAMSITLGAGAALDLAAPRGSFDLFDRVLFLRAMLPFAERRVGALVQLARHAAELRVDQGHELWREGDPAEGAVFVVRGVVRAQASAHEDVILGPGSVLGAFEALARAPRWFTATAVEPVLALVLGAERFFDVLEDRHELARDLLQDLGRAFLTARAAPPATS